MKAKPDYPTVALMGHPRTHNRRVKEHILVAERALGRYLESRHPVHHVDECVTNNSNANLVICEDSHYHKLLHQRRRALLACGHADWRKCTYCKKYDTPENLKIGTVTCHKACRDSHNKEYAPRRTHMRHQKLAKEREGSAA